MNFLDGEIILINKPLNWTSFQVVNKLRYGIRNKLGVKKIKVGHAGTLDPLADGLLIICTGKKTKEIDSFMNLQKTYSGVITLGANTPSYDLETEISETFDIVHLSREKILTAAQNMVGWQEQMPPIFSAKKVGGQRAYSLAREGKDVELKTKRIEIKEFEITNINLPEVRFKIVCSKGTYIRSIAYDFGKALNAGGYLSALRREQIGDYKLSEAFEIDDFLELVRKTE